LPDRVLATERLIMNRTAPDTPARPSSSTDPDDRNGRVVGENDDNALESIGKSIIAPIEGADEGAEPVAGDQGPAGRHRSPPS
jgi:hypothetical protein